MTVVRCDYPLIDLPPFPGPGPNRWGTGGGRPRMTSGIKGYVYLLDILEGDCKVGFTIDLRKRMGAHCAMDCYELAAAAVGTMELESTVLASSPAVDSRGRSHEIRRVTPGLLYWFSGEGCADEDGPEKVYRRVGVWERVARAARRYLARESEPAPPEPLFEWAARTHNRKALAHRESCSDKCAWTCELCARHHVLTFGGDAGPSLMKMWNIKPEELRFL